MNEFLNHYLLGHNEINLELMKSEDVEVFFFDK